MKRPSSILISAGETSGDRLGAGLARALLARRPDLRLVGMGGEQMAAAGVELIQDASDVAVVGILEVLGHLPALRRAMGRLEHCLNDRSPDLLVPIDFPDFNLRLARRARRAGVDVVYFVSPQVWAWRKGRVELIRRLVRRMLVLFPFEATFYEEAGVPVSFVGHPIADGPSDSRQANGLLAAAGLDPSREIVALVPGSRRSEIGYLLPVLLRAASIVQQRRPDVQFLLTLAPGLSRAEFEQAVAGQGLSDARIHAGDFPEILASCVAGAVASGTGSLEAAATGLPIVVVYKVHPLTYALARRLVRLDNVALPNLIAGRRVVPELIQGDCTPQNVADELLRWLEDPGSARAVRDALRDVRRNLGGPGVFHRAADRILEELDRRSAESDPGM